MLLFCKNNKNQIKYKKNRGKVKHYGEYIIANEGASHV